MPGHRRAGGPFRETEMDVLHERGGSRDIRGAAAWLAGAWWQRIRLPAVLQVARL